MQIFIVNVASNRALFLKTGIYSVGDNSKCFHDFKLVSTGDYLVAIDLSKKTTELIDARIVTSVFSSNISYASSLPRLNTNENIVTKSASLVFGNPTRAEFMNAEIFLHRILDNTISFFNGGSWPIPKKEIDGRAHYLLNEENIPTINLISVLRLIPANYPIVIKDFNLMLKELNNGN